VGRRTHRFRGSRHAKTRSSEPLRETGRGHGRPSPQPIRVIPESPWQTTRRHPAARPDFSERVHHAGNCSRPAWQIVITDLEGTLQWKRYRIIGAGGGGSFGGGSG